VREVAPKRHGGRLGVRSASESRSWSKGTSRTELAAPAADASRRADCV
jgi:hypothetical protein